MQKVIRKSTAEPKRKMKGPPSSTTLTKSAFRAKKFFKK